MPTQIPFPDVPTPGDRQRWLLNTTGFSVWIELGSAISNHKFAIAGLQDRVGIVGHLFGEIIGPLKIG
jgi:hypothetical protein